MLRLRFRRSLFALATALLIASVSTASAGSYVSLGLGGDPVLQGELMTAADGDGDGGNGRLALGQSFGRLALEGSLSRFALATDEATAAGVHARLTLPIDGAFGVFGRLGLERVWLGAEGDRIGDDTADGYVGGLGLEYRLKAPLLGETALWGEMSQDKLETAAGDVGARLWTLGVSVGI
jgi:hypothetical protein